VAFVSTVLLGGTIAATALSVGPSVASQGGDSGKRPDSERGLVETSPESLPVAESPTNVGKVIEISQESFVRDVIQSDIPVLVEFYAHWCGPCRLQSPILDVVAREVDQAKIVKVNIDENGELAAAYNVESIPTLLVFENRRLVARHVGLASRERIKTLLTRQSDLRR
jgi:thioredoxin 1